MPFLPRCSDCQAALASGANFCSHCGAPVEITPDDPDKVVGQLKLIHLALCIGLLGTLGVMAYVRTGPAFANTSGPSSQGILLSVAVGFALVVQPIRLLFRRKFRTGSQRGPTFYHTSKMIDWALLEGPALFFAILYLMTAGNGSWIVLGVFTVLFFQLVQSRPSIEEFEDFASADTGTN